ncbi:hypothetical protein EJ02DRAFT_363724 [Clathrospora elynae]|uniref:Uncharacterized protein n=1 Tax=Clathrospora elynae TaxID=706981 RepID=A0A6A5T6A0_9PLEO|nr:hypothetical protein EJ02DRAFT_363724 [Clathrospora elynae]
MLTYPDRHKFEQIRARWETAQPVEDGGAEMVGRREKQAVLPPVNGTSHANGTSKFRRTLSHGLAFISNPLSQRKITPGRHQVNVPALAVTEPSTTDVTTLLPACDAPLSPTRRSTSSDRSNGSPTEPTTSADNGSSTESAESDATHKPLLQSRTFSFIPLPVRAESKSFAADVEGAVKRHATATMPQPEPGPVRSKIPTPSPPLPERRRSSPRQYLHHHASQQIKHIAAAHAFAAANNGSPARYPLRSRTTPNLVKGGNSPQPAGFMAPRRPGVKRPVASPTTQKQLLQENVPTDRRITQRRSQIQEKSLRRESLAVPGTISNRRSFGPGAPLVQSTQPSFATPPTARKRLSSHLAQQTPVTAKRVQSVEKVKTHVPDPSPVAFDSSVEQPRLMGPPPTPTRQVVDLAKPTLPRLNTDKDLQRKTLGTPNGLGGVWRSSRALAVTTHEVRRLPRSRTFHNFGTPWETSPPVPPIPEQYRTPSLSNLPQHLRMGPDPPIMARRGRLGSDATSCYSIAEETDEEHTPYRTGRDRSSSFELSGSTNSLTALPSVASTMQSSTAQSSTATESTAYRFSNSPTERPWNISERQNLDDADVGSIFQVKDYMPPLYWAGRFQSRYDQWRTDAMIDELNLDPNHILLGPLGECTLNQEKLAACHIFAQLRDLCTSNQAADSLWEFEYRYRKDNKLLGSQLNLPQMPPRKHDDSSTSKGAFGRAIRKLTPRKTSLVNLVKGKGWNKSDETKHNDVFEQSHETSSDCS